MYVYWNEEGSSSCSQVPSIGGSIVSTSVGSVVSSGSLSVRDAPSHIPQPLPRPLPCPLPRPLPRPRPRPDVPLPLPLIGGIVDPGSVVT